MAWSHFLLCPETADPANGKPSVSTSRCGLRERMSPVLSETLLRFLIITSRLEFSIGWFADPIYKGQYPASEYMKGLEEREQDYENPTDNLEACTSSSDLDYQSSALRNGLWFMAPTMRTS